MTGAEYECRICGTVFTSAKDYADHIHSTTLVWDDVWGLVEK